MNRFNQVEQAIHEVLLADKSLMGMVKSLHKGLKDVVGYRDRIPAIGIKCVDISHNPETGEELGSGFCEVVAAGEYMTATENSETIASAVYDKLKHYGAAGHELKQMINGIDVQGMKSLGGDVDGRFYALTHVFFTVAL